MDQSIQTLIAHAKNQLTDSDSARLDSELLLQHVLDCDRSHLYAHPERTLDDQQIERFNYLLQKRVSGLPIAYLVDHKEFWSLTLNVNKHTLIPRSETEILVESALQTISHDTQLHILDLGTGSGAIALAIAKERPLSHLVAIDISTQALEVARQNATVNNIHNIHFFQSNWFEALPEQCFDMIISNPPYIKEHDSHLSTGDVRFEPSNALVSGFGGLDDLKVIISQSVQYLNKKGHLLVEHGYDQGETVFQLLKQHNYENIEPLHDLAGHHRASRAVYIND